jgi:hypothetical protein
MKHKTAIRRKGMTETKQQDDTTSMCGDGDEKLACCEQMFTMMQKFMGDQRGSFDCAAMMEKMGCMPQQKAK